MTRSNGTFSIVAMDPAAREWGIAVASCVLDVGYCVPWIRAEVGAVASQALLNPHLGPWVLEELERGGSAEAALQAALNKDPGGSSRQLGVIDREGNAAAYTGSSTLEWSGHRTAPFVCVQGNILVGAGVLDDMLAAFQAARGPLSERLTEALEAGDRAGGDRRGKQSAAVYVTRRRGGYDGVDDRLVDLKVLDHPEPVAELRRLRELWEYSYMAAAYSRLADEEPERSELFLQAVLGFLHRALESNLTRSEVYNNLAWHLALRKKYPEDTLKAARRALDLAPDDQNVMDTLAEACFAAGSPAEAVRWEEQALKRAPDNEFFQQQIARFRAAEAG